MNDLKNFLKNIDISTLATCDTGLFKYATAFEPIKLHGQGDLLLLKLDIPLHCRCKEDIGKADMLCILGAKSTFRPRKITSSITIENDTYYDTNKIEDFNITLENRKVETTNHINYMEYNIYFKITECIQTYYAMKKYKVEFIGCQPLLNREKVLIICKETD